MDGFGEITEVYQNRNTATVEWRIPDFSLLRIGHYSWSPTMTYFNISWHLGVNKTATGIDFIGLRRACATPDLKELVRFTIKCKTNDGEERDEAREQTFRDDRSFCYLHFDPRIRVPPSGGVTITCSLWMGDSPHAPGLLSLYAPKTPEHRPTVNASRTEYPAHWGMHGFGEITEVYQNGNTATVEWRIPDFSLLRIGHYSWSPFMTYFNMSWQLGVSNTATGIDFIGLRRERATPVLKESVRFTIKCKTSDGEETDEVREQTFQDDRSFCYLHFDPRIRVPPSGGVTITCSLWTGESLHAPGFLSLSVPKTPEHRPTVNASRTQYPAHWGMDGFGEITEVYQNRNTATVEWRIPDFSLLRIGHYSWSPYMTYFNIFWQLGVSNTATGIDFIGLRRERATPVLKESVRFTIKCKTSDGEETDEAREQTFRDDRSFCYLHFDPRIRVPPSGGVTITCSLWTGESPHASDTSTLPEN